MSEETYRELAVKTLRSIFLDIEAPSQAKATASRTLLELAGDIGKLQTVAPRESRALHELSREELDEEIKRWTASKRASKSNGKDVTRASSKRSSASPKRSIAAQQSAQAPRAPRYDF
jgi:hypothetical protein